MEALTLGTVEMHTGGEPVRIIASGVPPIPGATILDKRRYAIEHLDDLRRLLMLEPRGHRDMYGVIPVEPDHSEAAIGALFIHNEGFSTMCGHATIAIGRWAIDHGLVAPEAPETSFVLQVPAGPVTITTTITDGRTGSSRFTSVPAFVLHREVPVVVDDFGEVVVDVAYGGAFYAFADAAAYGLDVRSSPVAALREAAWATTQAVQEALPIEHPDDDDLGFLYGTILTDGADTWSEEPTANICVFADRQVDRSPTGSGVTARIAIQHAKGLIEQGQIRTFESVIGSRFTGTVIEPITAGDHPAVIAEVAGMAYYTGEATFRLEEGDPHPHFRLG